MNTYFEIWAVFVAVINVKPNCQTKRNVLKLICFDTILHDQVDCYYY